MAEIKVVVVSDDQAVPATIATPYIAGKCVFHITADGADLVRGVCAVAADSKRAENRKRAVSC